MAEYGPRRLERTVSEKIDPLSVVDYVFEDILALPGPGTVMRNFTPNAVLDSLGLPTLDEIARQTIATVRDKIRAKVR